MQVDAKKLFYYSLAVSFAFIGISALLANFSDSNFYRSGYKSASTKVLGSGDAPNSSFYIKLDQIPPATDQDRIIISGGKIQEAKVFLYRDDATTGILVSEDLTTESWSKNVELHNGVNRFKFKSVIDTSSGSNTNPLGVQANVNSDGTEISFSVEKLSSPLSVNFNYTKNPAPEGWVRIKAVFSKPLRTIPKLRLNQRGSIDIGEGVYMTGAGTNWYYDYLVHKENGDFYRNGTAQVSIVNAIDIYDRPLVNSSNDSFEIRASKETSTTSTPPESPSASIPESNQTMQDLSTKLNDDLQSKSSGNESSNDSSSKFDPPRIISVEPLNGLKRFSRSADIYLSVVYYRDPNDQSFNTKEYTVKGYNYDAKKNPIFVDFSRIDSDFKNATAVYGNENLLHGDLRQRLIIYTASTTIKIGDELLVPTIINDTRAVDLYDGLKLNVEDAKISITNLSSKKEKEFLLPAVKKNGVTISGIGAPNSDVNLFVFSSPVVTTVRTNDDGTWTYTVKEDLEVGVHNIYVSDDGSTDITKLIKIGDFKVYASEEKNDSDLYNNVNTETVEYFPSEFNKGIQKNERVIGDIFGKTLSTPLVIVVLGILSILIAGLIGYLFYRQSNQITGKEIIRHKEKRNEQE